MTGFDISDTLAPNSDQLDAVDLTAGPRVFTIEKVSRGNDEQPVNIHLQDFPRPWRPGKSMRRVLVACWGPDASKYVGRRVELYCDPSVVFGGMAVGGTRVSALSHLDKPRKVPLLVARGKSAIFTVQPLPDAPPPPAHNVTDVITADQLKQLAAAFRDHDIETKEDGLAYVSGVIGRDVTSSRELTQAEAQSVIDSLAEPPAAEGDQ